MSPSNAAANVQPQQHKRSRSAVLKSFVATGPKKEEAHSRAKSQSPSKKSFAERAQSNEATILPALPLDHLHAKAPLGELNNLQGRRTSPRKQTAMEESAHPLKTLHKKNKSAVSLKGLTGKSKDKSREKAQKEEPRKSSDEGRPKKSKSSTSLSALLHRPRSSKRDKQDDPFGSPDKENLSPPSSAADNQPPPPIWAQFASPQTEERTKTTKIPLNDSWTFNDEIDRYTPHEYSPSKGRDFYDLEPSLARKPETKSRPKSAIESPAARSLTDTFSRLRKASTSSPSSSAPEKGKQTQESRLKKTSTSQPETSRQRAISVAGKSKSENVDPRKPNSRVMAAVAAFNGKTREAELPPTPKEQKPDPVAIDKAFEAMLESRDTPGDVREKMRRLDTNMKSEFIRQNKSSTNLTELGSDSSRPGTGKRSHTDGGTEKSSPVEEAESPKKSRPRSLTFTLTKDSSPSKKQKSGRSTSQHSRHKSADLVRTTSAQSLNSNGGGIGLFGRSNKPAVPEDFITYLRKVQDPKVVEVGRLQKLRQLLRNETVSWTDSFITQGGMDEIVSLLNRIIEIEWREEHEDNLLHHALNCLKALLTTTLALTQLSTFAPTLFPSLLTLLFSSGEAKKGPAEYTTRTILISLLFAYLSASPTPTRAQALLSYLADPTPPESSRPVGFIASMHRARPYKRWCTEVSNVSKEVFWIFLHSANVIPRPGLPPTTPPSAPFAAKWFPQPRPPVPAAPYVGGVEWDATTYIAAHLDLLNGLIACLPTEEERNVLREELRDSGWEKVMGGSLRTCKEKFYGGVHAGLGTFVGAGRDDGWDVNAVREGPPRDASRSPRKSPVKRGEGPPQLEAPRIEALPRLEVRNGGVGDWL